MLSPVTTNVKREREAIDHQRNRPCTPRLAVSFTREPNRRTHARGSQVSPTAHHLRPAAPFVRSHRRCHTRHANISRPRGSGMARSSSFAVSSHSYRMTASRFIRLFRGKVGMGANRSRAPAHETPSPVYGGRLGWGRSGSRNQHRALLPLDAPLPTSPRCARGGVSAHETPSPACGGRLGWGHSNSRNQHRPPVTARRFQPPTLSQGQCSRAHRAGDHNVAGAASAKRRPFRLPAA
jgi:hypothetical protein